MQGANKSILRSDLALYADSNTRTKIEKYAGREVDDKGLIHDIVSCDVSPIVGILAAHKQTRKRPAEAPIMSGMF